MIRYNTKHFLTGEELSKSELTDLLNLAGALKSERTRGGGEPILKNKTLLLIFEKPSLRTHLSFTVAIQELGGFSAESYSSLRKNEDPQDVARVLAGYGHFAMIRTHAHSIVEKMAEASSIPIINGLTDTHHPCQILADLLTLKENYGKLEGLTLTYIGDGNNILHSLLLLLPPLGVNVNYACPKGYEPSGFILKRSRERAKTSGAQIQSFSSPEEAMHGAHAVYTDVWASMGFESEADSRDHAFRGYQLNEKLYALAEKDAIIMHCMPMIRGKEITSALADHPRAVLFQQSENRLHAQKALLIGLRPT